MQHRLGTSFALALALLIPAASSGWEEIECTSMGGTWVQQVPSSCDDRCDWAAWVRENGDLVRSGWGANRSSEPRELVPISLVLCAVEEWACANGFTATYDCRDRISLGNRDKSININISPAYRDPDTGEIDHLSPPGRSHTENRPGQTETHVERALQVRGGEGVLTTNVIDNHGSGLPTDLVWERRQATASVQIGGLAISGGYNEQFNKVGGCDGIHAQEPACQPFRSSPGEFESLFMDLVNHLVATSEAIGTWLDTGELPGGAGATAPAPAGEVEIVARATADGFQPSETSWIAKDFEPSTITVTGTVRDAAGRPVAGATVTLPDLGATATSDATGAFRLVGQAAGDRPMDLLWNVTLTAAVGAPTLRLDVAHQPLEVPVLADREKTATLSIRLMDCPDGPEAPTCTPVKAKSATVEVLDPDLLPFVTLDEPRPVGDSFATTIHVATPSSASPDLEGLWRAGKRDGASPLSLRLLVRARPAGDDSGVEGLATIPLELALLRGTTVDAAMDPRTEKDPPILKTSPRIQLTSSLSSLETGVFYVLVNPSVAYRDPKFVWRSTCHSPLVLPLAVIAERRNLDVNLSTGTFLDVGAVELLSPDEHERRIKGWVREFLAAMGFENGRVADAGRELVLVHVRYDVPGISQPQYGTGPMESTMGLAGSIQVGASAMDYWGTNAFEGEDLPYVIFFHELGHYVHKKTVDRWLEACLWDKKWAGAEHFTWTPPTVRRVAFSEKGVMMTSFFEATADFFAYAMFRFVEQTHPELKESLFLARGYLEGFDTDARAMEALHLGGCRVEGIQTSFWRELYASLLRSTPARAFGDFLRTTEAFKAESWIMRWVPARTIPQWVAMKRKHGGAGSGRLEGLARKYGVESCSAGFLLVPAAAGQPAVVTIDGTRHALVGRHLTRGLAPGALVAVEQGTVAVIVQRWAPESPGATLGASTGTSFRFRSATEVEVLRGSLAVDGPITVVNGNRKVTPTGTSSVVKVLPDGRLEVTVLEGSVQVVSPGRVTTITEGKGATVDPSGGVTAHPVRSAEELRAAFVGTEAPPTPPATEPPPPPIPARAPARPPAATASAPPPTAGTSPTPASALRYFVVLEAATSRPAVIAGEAGLRSGDRILEVHDSLDAAVGALRRLGGEAPPGAGPPTSPASTGPGTVTTPAPAPPAATGAAPSTATVPAGIEQLSMPSAVVSLGPSRALVLDPPNAWILEAGRGTPDRAFLEPVPGPLAEALTQQPVTPIPVHRGGRIVDALLAYRNGPGDALLFARADRHPDAWNRRRLLFASQIRTRTGSILLMTREDDGGTTSGVYVYHFPSATTLYCRDLRHSMRKAPASSVEGFPKLRTAPVAVPALRRGGATRSYLLLDGPGGGVWSVLNVRPHPLTPRIRKVPLDLRTGLGSPERPLELAAAPLLEADRSSDRALVCDGATGHLALLWSTGSPERLELRLLSGTLDADLATGGTAWRPVILPLHDRSAFWVLDRIGGRLAVVRVDAARATATMGPVEVEVR